MSRFRIALAAAAMVSCAYAVEGWRTSVYELAAWNKVAQSGGTHVFSPVGFASLACMLGEGATPEVRAAIGEELGLLNEFSSSFAAVRESYERASESNAVSITMAPSLWMRRPRMMERNYVHLLQNEFGAEVGVLDGIRSLNTWTITRTNGRIADIVPRLPRTGDAIAVCGIAFDGAWTNPFRDSPNKMKFKCADGTEKDVDALSGDQPMLKLSYPRFDLAVVPLAGGDLQLMIVRPKDGENVDLVRAEALTTVAFDEVKASVRQLLHAEDGERGTARLTIPVIDLTSSFDVLPLLTDYKVPHSGFIRFGQDSRLSLATLKVAARLGPEGVSLTPGRSEANEEEKTAAYERAKKLGAQTAAMHLKAIEEAKKGSPWTKSLEPFDCMRPFLFTVWDPKSDTTVVCGEYTGI